jgi:glutamate carboxypeptidase
MKAGLAVIVYVLSELNKKQALENITFTLIPDEEIGSYTFKDILHKEYKKHDFAFVYEEGTLESTPSIKTYEPARRALVVSRKGFGAGYFKIAGPGGHSGSLSAKTLRANTILEAAHKISELEHIADYEKGTTLNAGVISGGTTFNSIPALTEFWHDYRVQTFGERVRVKKTVEQLARKVFIKGTKTDFNWLHDIPPMQVNSEREQFAHQLVDGASKIGLNIIFEHRAGGSDANQVYMANPKAIVLDGFGPQGEHEHSKNEFLYIDSIEPAVIFSLLAIEQAIHSQPTS